MQKCLICGKKLGGRQTKYCSNKCKCVTSNAKYQNYACQQERGHRRKKELIAYFGGCCNKCGYSKNWAALCFHHTRDKEFGLTIRELSNNKWERCKAEAEKCILLCSNCHLEHHNPECIL